ncbi:hypothetical protein FRC07_014534 [Ceratobasidium sp. 392]|nr:hypothetical protein FRC07_014534 [Ceratobasidium sp. 392]
MAQVVATAVGQSRNPPLDPRVGITGTKWPPLTTLPLGRSPSSSTSMVPRSRPSPYGRPQSELERFRSPQYAPATVGRVAIDRPPSPYCPVIGAQPVQSRSRAFFDVVLADPLPPAPTPAPLPPPLCEESTDKPIAPSRQRNLLNPKQQGARKRGYKRKQPTPDESSEEEDDDSDFDEASSIDDSSDEDEPVLSRKGVLIMYGDQKSRVEPDIPTSDMRGAIPDTSCEETRRLFETEYSTHKKRVVKRRARRSAPGPSARPPKPKVEAVRKSSRLATRPATPIDADSSVTDISVAGSTRSASVVSARYPTPKPRSRPSKPKAAPRPKANSDRRQPAPQSTSIAHTPDDPPPPAPTNVVSLRPGYNAYTPEDKQWFLDFVAWVFRQNVHAGKAEICQDIFQQAPHHRLESWKSYWRDHISEVESLRNAARVNHSRQASHPRRAIALSRSDDEASAVPRARPPPSSSTSSESTDISVRGSPKDTFYDSIKNGRRRAHAALSGRVSRSPTEETASTMQRFALSSKHHPSRILAETLGDIEVENHKEESGYSYKREIYVALPQSLSKRPRW